MQGTAYFTISLLSLSFSRKAPAFFSSIFDASCTFVFGQTEKARCQQPDLRFWQHALLFTISFYFSRGKGIFAQTSDIFFVKAATVDNYFTVSARRIAL